MPWFSIVWNSVIIRQKLTETFEKQLVSQLGLVQQPFDDTGYSQAESVKGEERRGKPITTKKIENITGVEQVLKKYDWVSFRMIAESTRIPKRIVQHILQDDLKKRKLCSRFIPHTLTIERWLQRVSHTKDLLEMIENDLDFVDSIITGDKI